MQNGVLQTLRTRYSVSEKPTDPWWWCGGGGGGCVGGGGGGGGVGGGWGVGLFCIILV